MTLEELKGKVSVIKVDVSEWVTEGIITAEEATVVATLLIEQVIRKEFIEVN
jgi:hypothetical protein